MEKFSKFLKESLADSILYNTKTATGLAYGTAKGLLSTAQEVSTALVSSILLGPSAKHYLDKRKIHQCISVIINQLATLGQNDMNAEQEEETNRRRTELVDNIIASSRQKLDQKPQSQLTSRIISPITRGLAETFKGLFRTAMLAYAYSGPSHPLENLRKQDYENCLVTFAELITTMSEQERDSFFQELRTQVNKLNHPSLMKRFARNVGRSIYKNT